MRRRCFVKGSVQVFGMSRPLLTYRIRFDRHLFWFVPYGGTGMPERNLLACH